MNPELEYMQGEFEANSLQVVLVPSRQPNNCMAMVRVAVSRNCTWYRRLCLRHASGRARRNRAPDTCIRRQNIARVLARLVDGRPTRSKYAAELLRIAEQMKERAA